MPLRLALGLLALSVTLWVWNPALLAAQSPAELTELEHSLEGDDRRSRHASEDASEAFVDSIEDSNEYEVIASSRGGAPLPEHRPNHSRRISRNVGRAYGGVAAGFALTQVFCAIPALKSSGAHDFETIATWCGLAGLGLGFGLGPAVALRGEGHRGWGYVGSLLGTGISAALALAPRVPLGVAGVAVAILPVALALLAYELSDRAHRRRERRFARVFLGVPSV